MSHVDKLKNAKPITDLELFEVIVAAYPERFEAREEAGDDLWDEVMEFVEDDLVGELLCSEEGLRQLLGRILLLTNPLHSPLSGKLFHTLGKVDFRNGAVRMTSCAKAEIRHDEPGIPEAERPGAYLAE